MASHKGEPPVEKEGEEGYKKGGRKRKRRLFGGQMGALATPRLDKRPRAAMMKRGGHNPMIAREAKEEGESYEHEAKEKRSGKEDDDGEEDDRAGMASGGRLTAGERQSLPKSDFALPGKGEGPKGAGPGSYPINDPKHARLALAMGARHAGSSQLAAIKRRVRAKYPNISVSE